VSEKSTKTGREVGGAGLGAEVRFLLSVGGVKMTFVQQIGFVVAVFALGCATSLLLESDRTANPFFSEGSQFASPVGLPPRESAELRQVRQELVRMRAEQSQVSGRLSP
jgi:hypothetical protein